MCTHTHLPYTHPLHTVWSCLFILDVLGPPKSGLSLYLHAHRLTDDPLHQLIVGFYLLAKPCEFTILPLSCPPPLSPFPPVCRLMNTIFPLSSHPPLLSFFLDPTVLFGVTVHLCTTLLSHSSSTLEAFTLPRRTLSFFD